MSKRLRNALLKIAIALIFGLAISALVLYLHGYSGQMPLLERYRLLSDAFTIPGTLLLMLGLLIAISNTGAYTGLSYLMSTLFSRLIPAGRRHKEERYYDYWKRKRENPKMRGYTFLLLSGGLLLAAAIVFQVLFYQVRG